MKQYNYELTSIDQAHNAINNIFEQIADIPYSSILFHLYTIQFNQEEIKELQQLIIDSFPSAQICGTTTNGDICDGHLAEYGLVMAVSLFESTKTEVQLIECQPGDESQVGLKVQQIIDATDNIKAAEILITLKSINSHTILDLTEKCHKDIAVFGGGSSSIDVASTDTMVISNEDICHNGVLLITYSGDDFNIDIHHAIGWKPLGKTLTATKIVGKRLYELDNVPAGKIYSKYLDIQPDEDFFNNILEFPIMSYQHGNEVLRLPFSCNRDDGSIILAADIDEGTPINLSYGDPEVIRADVNELKNIVEDFAPQAVFLYSCGVRRLYWKYLINKETGIFSSIAPVCGFYSSGEIMRIGDYIVEHHVTLIAISMREGGKAIAQPTGNGDKKLPMTAEQKMHSQISMVRRLANFINVTAAELQEANDKLQEMADTDELTGFYNRRMLDKLLSDAIYRANKYNIKMSLGIIDIDDFKEVNDTYGHDAGDIVLKELSKAMFHEVDKLPSGIFGRWGGEEFLFLAPTLELDKIAANIEAARKRVSSIEIDGIGIRTISIGVTEFAPGDTWETVFKRADEALYEAKNSGKNKMCIK
ncbi:diguanylate cyclase (GGDEF) domain-containing protein [Pseudobutyrivibrio sp. YE44]|uniref:sensor domain-containing diguanylate cyclase n=1 Tax=Pseudobutyrivibrio sp. YE44 TaxID=1520802 RepID=UPI00088180B5|nr:diguanylate cyclase [Pseudobutyrivibrio sp. YE44]SDB11857.1 diguanylate cyclase (GGDEF) domain-containing protein [Pseudobutyrivibrio sp. YE44]